MWTVALVVCTAGVLFGPGAARGQARNVILCIGDGMGFEQVRAAGCFANGAAGSLAFEGFPYQGQVTTQAAKSRSPIRPPRPRPWPPVKKWTTASSAWPIPGMDGELETLLEFFRDRGKRTGLVTTTYMTHATPAAFGAHEPSRGNTPDRRRLSQPDPAHGPAGGRGKRDVPVVGPGRRVHRGDRRRGTRGRRPGRRRSLSGQFGSSHLPYEHDGLGDLPHLADMVAAALDILDNGPDGFFLMVEGGRIDHAGHDNRIDRNVKETVAFDHAVSTVMAWAGNRTDTLVLVTADHETGGLTVLGGNGAGNLPTVQWSTGGHTGVNVPVYAWGVNAELVHGVLDNTDIYRVARFAYTLAHAVSALQVACGAGAGPGDLWPDLDNDQRFGLQEAAFIVQRVAGVR